VFRRPLSYVLLTLLALAIVFGARERGDAAPSPTASVVPTDAEIRDADIVFFEKRLREDPQSAADRSLVASLYLKRSRETGNYLDVERAVAQAESSLALREGHNAGTFALLASARLAQHEFTKALAAARRLVEAEPENAAYRALLGEVLLELGRYDEASAEFSEVEIASSDLSIGPRLARWYELTGHLARAEPLARYLARRADAEPELAPEQKAWFHLRAGDYAAKRGHLDLADREYTLGLTSNPGDYRVLAARARVAMARGQWAAAVRAAEQSIAVQLEPGTLGLLRDAYRGLGDSAQAESYAAAMTATALTQPGAIHRAWGLHLVDHGERLADVLQRVRAELRERRDAYGWDLEAWTLHALGRRAAAWRSMERALSRGTEDALLFYHAAVIAAANGMAERAAEYASRAVELRGLLTLAQLDRMAGLTSAVSAIVP
jgi:tetratricopeptide (TPR) repeat protein